MNKLERLATAPMTASAAGFLAEVYGGPGTTIDDFAESLPADATVMDVGAGRSDLGLEVASRRPDVLWVNADIQYGFHDKVWPLIAVAEEACADKLQFTGRDVLTLPGDLAGRFDRVYSYNLTSHLLHIRRDLGRRAVDGMTGLLESDGALSIGPVHGRTRAGNEGRRAVELQASASEAEREAALDALTMSRLQGLVLDATNASGVSILPADRFRPGAEGHLLFDHRDETYHRLLTSEGLRLAARLAAGFTQSNKFDEPPELES